MSKLSNLYLLTLCLIGSSFSLKSMEHENKAIPNDVATCDLIEGCYNLASVKEAFTHRADPNTINPATDKIILLELINYIPFSRENEKDLPDIVREFVNQPTLKQEIRDIALKDAASRGLAKTVHVLLRGGANVHTLHEGCHKDWTALHFAAKYDHLAAVKVLVEEGHANIDALDAKGNTPVKYTNREILDYFEDQKRLSQKTWRTFTHLAREASKTSLGRSLIEHQKEAMSAAVLLFIILLMYTMNSDKA